MKSSTKEKLQSQKQILNNPDYWVCLPSWILTLDKICVDVLSRAYKKGILKDREDVVKRTGIAVYSLLAFVRDTMQVQNKIFTLAATTLLMVVLVGAPVVFAASPHFIKTPKITKNSNFSLTANFKAAGLANIVSKAFLSSSGGTASLQCVNPGGNNPPPKQVSFGPLQGQKVDIQPQNGQITGTVTIGPPPLPSASQICPNPNWDVKIVSLTYDNVVLHIQQNGVDILTFNFGNVDP